MSKFIAWFTLGKLAGITIVVVFGIVLVMLAYRFFFVPLLKKYRTNTAPAAPQGNQAARTPWNWKSIWKVVWRVVILVVIIWWIHSCNSKTVRENEQLKQRLVNVETVERSMMWVFTWRMKHGEYSPLGPSRSLQLRVEQNNAAGFKATMMDMDGQVEIEVGGLWLSRIDKNLIGSWKNYLDGDGGDVELFWQNDHLWTGTHKLKDGRVIHCELKKVIKPMK